MEVGFFFSAFQGWPQGLPCAMGAQSFPGIKWLGCGVEHSHPSNTEVANGLEIYPCLLSVPAQTCHGVSFTFYTPSLWRRVAYKCGNHCAEVKQGVDISHFCAVLLETTVRHIFCIVLNDYGAVITVRIVLNRTGRNHMYFIFLVKQ